MVAGGRGDNGRYLSSTEILTPLEFYLALAEPLPRAVYGVVGVTAWGRLYMTGMVYHTVDI